jgi:hypothetical protein
LSKADFSSAVKVLDSLMEEARTPLMIVFAFHDTVEEIGRVVDAHNKANR